MRGKEAKSHLPLLVAHLTWLTWVDQVLLKALSCQYMCQTREKISSH